ncbi:hypothetical protein KP509_10G025800 [Ceratopteris richardii]|uniref:VQ domain-containing protein n=1 Tax=Ceratopteris richardii TaxID=49495 RepID=A0A8T2TVV2_CERRI|nr:hypothetical protein KP509_10G025800 [Ceratopteris richardii]
MALHDEELQRLSPYRERNDKSKANARLPIIRVIQIDSPVFVHTDVSNFRATVQSLTAGGCGSSKPSSGAADRNSRQSCGCIKPTSTSVSGHGPRTCGCSKPISAGAGRHSGPARPFSGPNTSGAAVPIMCDFCLSSLAQHPLRTTKKPPTSSSALQHHCNLKSPSDGTPRNFVASERQGVFNEGDILAGLISEEPLPDLSTIPPLQSPDPLGTT